MTTDLWCIQCHFNCPIPCQISSFFLRIIVTYFIQRVPEQEHESDSEQKLKCIKQERMVTSSDEEVLGSDPKCGEPVSDDDDEEEFHPRCAFVQIKKSDTMLPIFVSGQEPSAGTLESATRTTPKRSPRLTKAKGRLILIKSPCIGLSPRQNLFPPSLRGKKN